MNYSEQAFTFRCGNDELLGIAAVPDEPRTTGVLVVVGGPQYRVGSHRQFLLLARALAGAGFPAMRFDYRGMGDSGGERREFTAIDDDIAAAIEAFRLQCPEVGRVVLWGLCDAASACLLYCDGVADSRVGGLVLLNPWVRSEATLARTHIKHYYGQRLLEADFWCKLLTGRVGIGSALGGFVNNLLGARRQSSSGGRGESLSFQQRMRRGLQQFDGPVLLVLSGGDYTAKEFLEVVDGDARWSAAVSRTNVTRQSVDDADHTFSSAEWRRAVETATTRWLTAAFHSVRPPTAARSD